MKGRYSASDEAPQRVGGSPTCLLSGDPWHRGRHQRVTSDKENFLLYRKCELSCTFFYTPLINKQFVNHSKIISNENNLDNKLINESNSQNKQWSLYLDIIIFIVHLTQFSEIEAMRAPCRRPPSPCGWITAAVTMLSCLPTAAPSPPR